MMHGQKNIKNTSVYLQISF